MNPLILFVAFMLLRDARAIVELDCSDNATCIDNMAKEVIRSVRQQRTVKLFNVLTIDPLRTRQARMARSMDSWLETFLEGNAFSFDWNDYTFRVSQADDSNALDLEIYQGRTAKDVSDPNAKKSSTKNEEKKEEDETPKIPGHRVGLRRRQKKKKVMQVIVPLLFGMKSAGVVLFAMAVVTVLTLKAFMASKVALLVTVGMAAKKLYETYGTGVGLQNHPYLYSQYPIDFPSASSHAYSVSGVSPQFASPEMYSPTGMGAHAQANEIIQQGDATAQQSQQAPLLVNSTRAAERWDGKSKLLKFLEPVIDGIRNIIDPIANVFYGAIPATVRGLNSDVSTTKSVDLDDDLDELEIVKRPRQVLVPQPRYIAQRKMAHRKNRYRPKKYTELKISLDRLKNNKDLQDYIKTKKYKFNYPNTYFYPRVKYFVNPNSFLKPSNNKLMPYSKEASYIVNTTMLPIINNDAGWKPIPVYNHTSFKNITRKQKRRFRKRHNKKRRNRPKRSTDVNAPNGSARTILSDTNYYSSGRTLVDLFDFLFAQDHVENILAVSTKYTQSKVNNSLQSDAPGYYTMVYNLVMMSLDFMDSLFKDVGKADKSRRKRKDESKTTDTVLKYVSNCTQVKNNVESKGRGTQ